MVTWLSVARIGADEKAGTVVGDPGRELVEFAIDRVQQYDAANAVADPADVKAPCRGHESAAVTHDDDRQVRKRLGRARIAVKPCKVIGRFIDEALEPARLPEFAGAG